MFQQQHFKIYQSTTCVHQVSLPLVSRLESALGVYLKFIKIHYVPLWTHFIIHIITSHYGPILSFKKMSHYGPIIFNPNKELYFCNKSPNMELYDVDRLNLLPLALFFSAKMAATPTMAAIRGGKPPAPLKGKLKRN